MTFSENIFEMCCSAKIFMTLVFGISIDSTDKKTNDTLFFYVIVYYDFEG